MLNKIKCRFYGHDWQWIFDDQDARIYRAGNCMRCGELGDGLTPIVPDYPFREMSEGIVIKGFRYSEYK
jgi:hypothetical protein